MRAIVLVVVVFAASAPWTRAQDEERGFFGVGISDVGRLVLITDVYANTAASRAGAEPGDVILTIDGVVPGSTQGMIARVKGMKPGTAVHFRLLRGARVIDVRAALGKRDENPAPSGRALPEAIAKRIAAIQALEDGSHYEQVYGWAVAALQGEQRDEARALCALARELARAEANVASRTTLRVVARWLHKVAQATWLERLSAFERPVPLNHGRPDLSDEAIRQRIGELVAELGDPSYARRERASRELIRLGPPVIPELPPAMASPDREGAWRARWLKQAIEERLAVPVYAWHPVVLEVVSVAGDRLATRVAMGVAPVAGARYRAMVWSASRAREAEVAFTAVGPETLRLVAGTAPAPGTRLLYLAPVPTVER